MLLQLRFAGASNHFRKADMNIQVRPATDSDTAAIDAVRQSAVFTLRKVYRPTTKAIEIKTQMMPRLNRLVAILDLQVVGSVDYDLRTD